MNRLNTLLALAFLAAGPCLFSQTLHVVMVANTESTIPAFAEICRADSANMEAETTEMAKGAGLEKKVHRAVGSQFTAQHLQGIVDGLRPNADDRILFYYSGAALCNTADPAKGCNRVLLLSPDGSEQLPTNALFQSIEDKGAQLNVFLVDACGTVRKTRSIDGHRGGAVHRVYRSLFSACGTVRLFSSLCGQYSYGKENGSLFTNAFIAAIDHYINRGAQNATWAALMEWAYDTTVQKAQEITREQYPVGCFEKLREGCVP